jgi:hypothetical protein
VEGRLLQWQVQQRLQLRRAAVMRSGCLYRQLFVCATVTGVKVQVLVPLQEMIMIEGQEHIGRAGAAFQPCLIAFYFHIVLL